MSNQNYCDWNSKVDTPKLYDICHNPNCKFQKYLFLPQVNLKSKDPDLKKQ